MKVITTTGALQADGSATTDAAPRNLAREIESRVRSHAQEILRRIGRAGDELGIPVYLVGGFVRDLLLGRDNADLDLVAEGDALLLARRLGPLLGADAKCHGRFGTAVLSFPDGSHLDLATARTESYARPGALPDVEISSIEEDLRRRDVTLNAMAIHLGERRFGDLLDPYHGGRDLDRRELRVLHDRSLLDDPTRIMRIARFEARFGFRMESRTLELARGAVRGGAFGTVTPERFRRELLLGLEESDPLAVVRRWADLEVLEHLSPGLNADEALIARAVETLPWFARLRQRETPDRSLLLLTALLAPLGPEGAARACGKRLRYSRPRSERLRTSLQRAPALAEAVQGRDVPALAKLLKPESLDTILFAAASTPSARDALATYLQKHRHVKLGITGDDLVALGRRPGPAFGAALEAALDEKIGGRLRTRKQELEFVLDRLDRA